MGIVMNTYLEWLSGNIERLITIDVHSEDEAGLLEDMNAKKARYDHDRAEQMNDFREPSKSSGDEDFEAAISSEGM